MTDAPNAQPNTATASGPGSPAGGAPVSVEAGAASVSTTNSTPAAAAPSPEAAAPQQPASTPPETLLGAKPAETKSPAVEPNAQQPAADPSKDAAAPAPYEFVLPETLKITDQKQFDVFKSVMQKVGIPADKAPEMVAFAAKHLEALQSQALVEQQSVWEKTNTAWKDAVMKDKEIGGDKWPGVQQQLGGLLAEFGKDIPTLRQSLDYTGAGNHPDIIKFLYNVSKALQEGGHAVVGKNANASKAKTKTGTLYDNTGA